MAAEKDRPGLLVVIIGETGSGKSALAMELAKKFNGEIISADSRAVYKGLDIGTAKPTKEDQAKVRHHLIDIKNPAEKFTAADFKELANETIKNIHKRRKLPLLVGGSGLYIDAVIYNFSFKPNERRDPENPRHLLKSQFSADKRNLRPNTLLIGLQIDRKILKNRLGQRVEDMVTRGFNEEVSRLVKEFGFNTEAFRAPGYKAFIKYLNKEISLEEAKELFVRYDLNLAKRQRTWFKRNKSIHWITNREQAVELVTTFLNK